MRTEYPVPGEGAAGRRRLSSAELAVWRGFIEVTQELRARLTADLQESSNLSSGDYEVLLALSEVQGRSLRSSDLATAVGWERSRLSHHLGRMERRGLIARAPSSTDSRGAEVSMTAEAADTFRRATTPHARAIKENFADALTAEQMAQLRGIVDTLRRHLSAEGDGA